MVAPKDDSRSGKTLTGLGNLIRLLPTGTLFVFQFLNPVLTNSGNCSTLNKYLTSILIALCGLSCGFSCFTDSYKGSDGITHFGIATLKGLWPSDHSGSGSGSSSSVVDLSSYKIRLGDFVHALLSMNVFAVLSLLNANTVRCFYPSFESTQKSLLMALPPAIGAVSGVIFTVFPYKRHGIGYPPAASSSDSSVKS